MPLAPEGFRQACLQLKSVVFSSALCLLLVSCNGTKQSVNSAEKIPFREPQTQAQLLDSGIVRRIRFPDVRADHLTADVVHVIEVGDATESEEYPIEEVPLDFVINSGQPANYFGYKYTSQDAALERKNQNNQAFRVRFPGVFFASQRARIEDASHGGGIRKMEQDGGFTFAPTDLSENAVRFSPNALYVIVVNEPGGVIMNMQGKGRCGDGWKVSAEQCDDLNELDGDGCSKTCQIESGWTCTGVPSQCTRLPPGASSRSSSESSSSSESVPSAGFCCSGGDNPFCYEGTGCPFSTMGQCTSACQPPPTRYCCSGGANPFCYTGGADCPYSTAFQCEQLCGTSGGSSANSSPSSSNSSAVSSAQSSSTGQQRYCCSAEGLCSQGDETCPFGSFDECEASCQPAQTRYCCERFGESFECVKGGQGCPFTTISDCAMNCR